MPCCPSAAFLGGNVGCLTGSEVGAFTSVPVLPLRQGRHQSDRGRITLARFHSRANLLPSDCAKRVRQARLRGSDAPVGGLREDGAVLLDLNGPLATHQSLIFAVGGCEQGPGALEIGSVVLGLVQVERRHDFPPTHSVASEPQTRIMAATASSANQLTSKRPIAPRINFFFMAISRIIRVLALDLAWFARTGQGLP